MATATITTSSKTSATSTTAARTPVPASVIAKNRRIQPGLNARHRTNRPTLDNTVTLQLFYLESIQR